MTEVFLNGGINLDHPEQSYPGIPVETGASLLQLLRDSLIQTGGWTVATDINSNTMKLRGEDGFSDNTFYCWLQFIIGERNVPAYPNEKVLKLQGDLVGDGLTLSSEFLMPFIEGSSNTLYLGATIGAFNLSIRSSQDQYSSTHAGFFENRIEPSFPSNWGIGSLSILYDCEFAVHRLSGSSWRPAYLDYGDQTDTSNFGNQYNLVPFHTTGDGLASFNRSGSLESASSSNFAAYKAHEGKVDVITGLPQFEPFWYMQMDANSSSTTYRQPHNPGQIWGVVKGLASKTAHTWYPLATPDGDQIYLSCGNGVGADAGKAVQGFRIA